MTFATQKNGLHIFIKKDKRDKFFVNAAYCFFKKNLL